MFIPIWNSCDHEILSIGIDTRFTFPNFARGTRDLTWSLLQEPIRLHGGHFKTAPASHVVYSVRARHRTVWFYRGSCAKSFEGVFTVSGRISKGGCAQITMAAAVRHIGNVSWKWPLESVIFSSVATPNYFSFLSVFPLIRRMRSCWLESLTCTWKTRSLVRHWAISATRLRGRPSARWQDKTQFCCISILCMDYLHLTSL